MKADGYWPPFQKCREAVGWQGPLNQPLCCSSWFLGVGSSVAELGVEGQAARHTLQCDLVSSLCQVLLSRVVAPREVLIHARVPEGAGNMFE